MKQKQARDKNEIVNYRQLCQELLALRDEGSFGEHSMRLTEKILQINPEFTAAWNYRSIIIIENKEKYDNDLGLWKDELDFTARQIKRFPKVYAIWNHRVWTLRNIRGIGGKTPKSDVEDIWKQELHLVDRLLDLDARNFHGWTYRRLITDELYRMTGDKQIQRELDYTTRKINQNISNYSAWHHRVQYFPQLVDSLSNNGVSEFLEQEVKYITNAIYTDADDQAVWFYIKWFINQDFLKQYLSKGRVIEILDGLVRDIIAINNDDISFTGKENVWCLKGLLVIDKARMDMAELSDKNTRSYLMRLLVADPLHKERYNEMLEGYDSYSNHL